MALWSKKSDQPEPGPLPESAGNGVQPARAGDAAAPAGDPERMLKAARASRRLSSAFGQIVTVLMRSDAYKHMMLSDLQWFVAPALIAGQFSIAEARSKEHGLITPIGVVLWARVSPEVDKRLSSGAEQPIRLKPGEWTSGEIPWIVDAIGDRRVINVMLRRMTGNEWKGRTVKLRARGKDGRLQVAELKVKPAAPPVPPA